MLGKMRECLDSLPDDRNKAAMIRCIVHGESYGKIGEELGASKEGVRKMVNRTLKQLRTMMCSLHIPEYDSDEKSGAFFIKFTSKKNRLTLRKNLNI